ncbi:MAG: hypothetical protein IMY67_01800 [Bacteroidetes bacterium]|nr:hypothetical protein [Bacteroidota bacterium]
MYLTAKSIRSKAEELFPESPDDCESVHHDFDYEDKQDYFIQGAEWVLNNTSNDMTLEKQKLLETKINVLQKVIISINKSISHTTQGGGCYNGGNIHQYSFFEYIFFFVIFNIVYWLGKIT